MDSQTDYIKKLEGERDRARNLACSLEQELSDALERIEALNNRIAGLTGKEQTIHE